MALSDTVFYIDVQLSESERGEEVAKKLFDLGYKNLYLATGYESDEFSHVTWIKGVVGKILPFNQDIIVHNHLE